MSTDANATAPGTAPEPLVLSRREGAITRITLNRPRAINALNREMFELLDAAVTTAVSDGSAAILLDGAGERGFCGGGDIKQLSGPGGREILALEYRVDHRIATAPIPVVGIMDGVTMGGGIGLTGHASHRVVTERSRLAMPEARIGIVPDVGGHLLLGRAPGRLGELLAVTAGEFGAGDAIALGFADSFVPSERLEQLGAALAAGEEPGAVCARLAEPAPVPELPGARAWWDDIAEPALGAAHPPIQEDPAGAALRLLAALDGSGSPLAAETADTVRRMCPASVAITLAQLDRTRRLDLDLAAVLADDLRVCSRMAARPDFAEGVRAQVIDKDRTPRWSPASLAGLDPAELAAILAPLRPEEPALEL
ncbi:enoyl-CoA hydratase/isomerase family protein [Leucobacter massiliensis]|uniref:3-hydroxyisobutyryl-CoA hydrolase n=1 Tax=Leucobacter massiliensis TaxID=1686285 RepID=A0A2S9QMM3_9MICO|nr:enoyl-CoA hydratase/isomerase family protein [Leucobacter massiliensis]PRI10843.1 3-hydroxyisobutyryl-CoA hydrolase [Leucobacter massiliensis]